MIWAGLANLIYFINSIVWNGRVGNYAPVWCDICESHKSSNGGQGIYTILAAAKYIIGLNVALPACCLCINRRLYHIATANAVTVTRAEKRRAVLVDLAICIGIPALSMILRECFHRVPTTQNSDPGLQITFLKGTASTS